MSLTATVEPGFLWEFAGVVGPKGNKLLLAILVPGGGSVPVEFVKYARVQHFPAVGCPATG